MRSQICPIPEHNFSSKKTLLLPIIRIRQRSHIKFITRSNIFSQKLLEFFFIQNCNFAKHCIFSGFQLWTNKKNQLIHPKQKFFSSIAQFQFEYSSYHSAEAQANSPGRTEQLNQQLPTRCKPSHWHIFIFARSMIMFISIRFESIHHIFWQFSFTA